MTVTTYPQTNGDDGSGGTGVTAATAAEIAALAVAAGLTPGGIYFDPATGIHYLASSASTYAAVSASAHLGTMAFATAIATPDLVTGMTFNASDVGNQNPLYRYDGTNFRPAGGRQLAFTLGLDAGQTTGAGNGTEVALSGCSCLFPIRSIDFTGAGIAWEFGYNKEAANAESPIVNMRIGSTNDAAGAVLAGPFTLTAGSARMAGGKGKAVRQSTTTLRLAGQGNSSAYDRYDGSGNVARPAASACANTNTTANYLNLCAQAGTPFAEYIVVHQYDIYVMG